MGRSAARMAQQAIDAILIDALGTLVRMEPPGPRLRVELQHEGIEVSEAEAEAAFSAEIRFYLAHHLEGSDPERLDELRDRCAAVLAAALPEGRRLDHNAARAAMLRALRFEPYPDAAPALRELRERGLGLVVVSNWDSSLPDVLERAGLGGLVDAVVSSASAGAVKPDPAIFAAGLEAAGVDAPRALFVGDSLERDVEGARAAGMRALLLDRAGVSAARPAIRSLAELASLT
jgi:putative hydrolase of the HAD superfamily